MSEKKNQEITEYYDKHNFTEFWNDGSKTILNAVENELLAGLMHKFFTNTGGWFFDIGCGFARNLMSYYNKNRQFLLVDYSLTQIETAARRYKDLPNVHYIVADAKNLPFKDNVFASGISIRLLHHIPEPDKYFRELQRITCGNTLLILSYMNKRNFFRIFKYGAVSFKKDHSNISDIIYASHPGFIKSLCAQYGFKIIAHNGSGFLHQLAHASGRIQKYIDKHADKTKTFMRLEKTCDSILGALNLSLMQFIVLKKVTGTEPAACTALEHILKCPYCGGALLEPGAASYRCGQCRLKFPVKNKIIDFRNTEAP